MTATGIAIAAAAVVVLEGLELQKLVSRLRDPAQQVVEHPWQPERSQVRHGSNVGHLVVCQHHGVGGVGPAECERSQGRSGGQRLKYFTSSGSWDA